MPEDLKIEIREGGTPLTEADSDFELFKPPVPVLRLDLACGQQKREGFIGVDFVDALKGDYPEFVLWDLNIFPWPWEDSSVYELNCSHYVEHIGFDEGHDLITFMNECYRILTPQGTIKITHPYATSPRAFQDPTHKRYINEITWKYFDAKWRELAKVSHYPITADFEIVSAVAVMNPEWAPRAEEARHWAMRHLWGTVDDFMVTLRTRK